MTYLYVKQPKDLRIVMEMEYPWDFRVYSLAKRWQCCSAEFQMSFLLYAPPPHPPSHYTAGHCLPLQQSSFQTIPEICHPQRDKFALKCRNNLRVEH